MKLMKKDSYDYSVYVYALINLLALFVLLAMAKYVLGSITLAICLLALIFLTAIYMAYFNKDIS